MSQRDFRVSQCCQFRLVFLVKCGFICDSAVAKGCACETVDKAIPHLSIRVGADGVGWLTVFGLKAHVEHVFVGPQVLEGGDDVCNRKLGRYSSFGFSCRASIGSINLCEQVL